MVEPGGIMQKDVRKSVNPAQLQLSGYMLTRYFVALLMLAMTASSVLADWRDEKKSLRIGIVGGDRPALARRHVEPFRQVLEQALQVKVTVLITENYTSLINTQANAGIDYGIHTASSFATVWTKCQCVEAMAAASLSSGVNRFYSIILAERGEIDSVKTLAGKRVAIPGKKSLTGYILPARELQKQGLVLGDDRSDNDTVQLVPAGSTEKALELFLGGEVDGVFGWSTMSGLASSGYSAGTLTELIRKSGRSAADFAILWKSAPIPGGPHVVSNKLPEPAKRIIKRLLLGLNDNSPAAYDAVENFNSGGFTKVDISDYQVLIDLVGGEIPAIPADSKHP